MNAIMVDSSIESMATLVMSSTLTEPKDRVALAPSWLGLAVMTAASDDSIRSFYSSMRETQGEDRQLTLSRLNLLNNANIDLILQYCYETAMSTRAQWVEISSLRGQLLTMEAEIHQAVSDRERTTREITALNEEYEHLKRHIEQTQNHDAQQQVLNAWGDEAKVLGGGMYSASAISSAVGDQMAIALRNKDDSEIVPHYDRVFKRAEERARKELQAYRSQVDINEHDWILQMDRSKGRKALLDSYFSGVPSVKEESISLPSGDVVPLPRIVDWKEDGPHFAVQSSLSELAQPGLLAELIHHDSIVRDRVTSLGPDGYDFERRLASALIRYSTERLMLKLYIHALISSIGIIPPYAEAVPHPILSQLERLAMYESPIGEGADDVLECLGRLDVVMKRIAVNTIKQEIAFSIVMKKTSGVLRGEIKIETDKSPRLFRYIRVATLSDHVLLNVSIMRDGSVANTGKALPIQAGTAGEPVASMHFWNSDPAGTWTLTATAATAIPENTKQVRVFFCIGFESFEINSGEDIGVGVDTQSGIFASRTNLRGATRKAKKKDSKQEATGKGRQP